MAQNAVDAASAVQPRNGQAEADGSSRARRGSLLHQSESFLTDKSKRHLVTEEACIYAYFTLQFLEHAVYMAKLQYPDKQTLVDISKFLYFIWYNQITFNLAVHYNEKPYLRIPAYLVACANVTSAVLGNLVLYDKPWSQIYVATDVVFALTNLYAIWIGKYIYMMTVTDVMKGFIFNSLFVNTIITFNDANSLQYIFFAWLPLQSEGLVSCSLLQKSLADPLILIVYIVVGALGGISVFMPKDGVHAMSFLFPLAVILIVALAEYGDKQPSPLMKHIAPNIYRNSSELPFVQNRLKDPHAAESAVSMQSVTSQSSLPVESLSSVSSKADAVP